MNEGGQGRAFLGEAGPFAQSPTGMSRGFATVCYGLQASL